MKGEWARAVEGVVKRCEVAAAFDGEVVFNTKGSRALSKLMCDMARIIDEEIERRAKADG